MQQPKELAEIDDKFTFSESRLSSYYLLFYEDYIFYTRYYGESGPHISEEDQKDMQENIYKYNIYTKEIEQIKIEEDQFDLGFSVYVELEALNYLYPGLKKAISSNCNRSCDFGRIFYDNGRIFFSTYFSSSARGTTEHL